MFFVFIKKKIFFGKQKKSFFFFFFFLQHPVYCVNVVGTQNAHNLISVSTDGKMCSWSLDMLSQPQVCVDYSLLCLWWIQDFRGGSSRYGLLKTVPCRGVQVHPPPENFWNWGPQIWDLRYSEAKSACDLGVWPTSRTLLDPPQCMVKKKGKSFVYFNCQRKFSLLSRLLREQLVLVPCE